MDCLGGQSNPWKLILSSPDFFQKMIFVNSMIAFVLGTCITFVSSFPEVQNEILKQIVEAGESFDFQIPDDTFNSSTNSDISMRLNLTLLPSWLSEERTSAGNQVTKRMNRKSMSIRRYNESILFQVLQTIGLIVLDVSTPSNPVVLGVHDFDDDYFTNDFVVKGNKLIVAVTDKLAIYDVTNILEPVLIGEKNTPTTSSQIVTLHLDGDYLYCTTTGSAGYLWIYEVSDFTDPIFRGEFSGTNYARGISCYDDVCYLATKSRFWVLDVSGRHVGSNPSSLGYIDIDIGHGRGVELSANGYVYLGKWDLGQPDDGLYILNCTDPSNIVIEGTYITPNKGITGLYINHEDAYIYMTVMSSGFYILNISNPISPVKIGQTGAFVHHGEDILEFIVENSTSRYAYASNEEEGIFVIDTTSFSTPDIIWKELSFPSNTKDVAIYKDTVFYLTSSKGAMVFDISKKSSPQLVHILHTPTFYPMYRVYTDGVYVYFAVGYHGLAIYDFLTLSLISFADYDVTTGAGVSLDVIDNFVYLAYFDSPVGKLIVLNVTDPYDVEEVGRTPSDLPYVRDVVCNRKKVNGKDYCYYASSSGIVVIDVTDKANPVVVGSQFSTNSVIRLDFAHGGKVLLSSDYADQIQSFDIFTDPENPKLLCSLDLDPMNPKGIKAKGNFNFAYVVTHDYFKILNIQNASNLVVSQTIGWSVIATEGQFVDFYDAHAVVSREDYFTLITLAELRVAGSTDVCGYYEVVVEGEDDTGTIETSFIVKVEKEGYADAQCEVYFCNSVMSNETTTVCGGHGNCTIPGKIGLCECEKNFNETDFCGSCNQDYFYEVSNEVCVEKCYEVYNVEGNENIICGGHGQCNIHSRCDCDEEWYAPGETICNITSCFGVYQNDSEHVCNGEKAGLCVDTDTCLCSEGYYFGPECNVTTCDGVLNNDTSNPLYGDYCGSKGFCTHYDHCTCILGYFGKRCEMTTCNGIFMNDSVNVCSNGRGNCSFETRTCLCEENYFGDYCGITTCDSIPSNDTTNKLLCHGHGTCDDFQECGCDRGYFDDFCDVISVCGEIFGNSSSVCSFHGDCVPVKNTDTFQCRCEKGYENDKNGVAGCIIERSNDDDKDGNKNDIVSILPWLIPASASALMIFALTTCCFMFLLCFACVVPICCFCLCVLCSLVLFVNKKREDRNLRKKIDSMKLREDHFDKEDKIDKESMAHLEINNSLFEIPLEDIKLLSLLGKGGSNSVVYKVDYNGVECAYKQFKTTDLCKSQDNFDEFEKEVSILSSISHPHTLRFYGALLNPPRVGIVMEYCKNGDMMVFLSRYMRENDEEDYPIKEKIRMLKEIALACEFLHKRKIIHRDLKPENVLVDANEHCKLMDFGCSKLVDRMSAQKTKRLGTSTYMAPEITLGNGTYDEKVDVFSYGIMIFCVVTTNFQPYGEVPCVELKVANDPDYRPDVGVMLKKLGKKKKRKNKKSKKKTRKYEWLKEMTEVCWDSEAEDRYSFEEISKIFEKKLKLTQKTPKKTPYKKDDDDDDEKDDSDDDDNDSTEESEEKDDDDDDEKVEKDDSEDEDSTEDSTEESEEKDDDSDDD